MNVPEELKEKIMNIYTYAWFQTSIMGNTSDWHRQATGILQGCPLSPYLFLIVMTAMFYDIQQESIRNLVEKRIPNTNFDEILYADDTICVSSVTRVINRRLAHIEKHGNRYGMKLNKGKYEVLTKSMADVHFSDGSKVQHKEDVKYLGCTLNMKADTKKEVNARIGICMAIMK